MSESQEEDSYSTLQQKVKHLEQEIKKAEKEHIFLKSQNEKLQKKLNLQRCLRYQPQFPPPSEIDPKNPITIIANEIWNVHVCRARQDLENWTSQSFNYTGQWDHKQVMEIWGIYKWDCLLGNIPQAEQMQLELTKSKSDKYTMKLVLSSNCLTGSYGYCSQPAEAVSYQPKLGKIYIYIYTPNGFSLPFFYLLLLF